MPLSDLQIDIFRRPSAQRTVEHYVAGSTSLNRDGPRFSGDIDIFRPREEAAADATRFVTKLLADAGFTIKWLCREPGIHSAEVRRLDESVKLEWVRDSDFRFFPLMRDALFGYTLHVIDIATNKAIAAAARQAPRDVLDLLYIHDFHLPLGAVVWAAVENAPGFTLESLIAEIRATRGTARKNTQSSTWLSRSTWVQSPDVCEPYLAKPRCSFVQCRLVKKDCCSWKMDARSSPIPNDLIATSRTHASCSALALVVGNRERDAGTLWETAGMRPVSQSEP